MDVKSITQILLLTLTGKLNSILNSFCCDGHSLMLYTQTRWALTPTFAREEWMVLQLLSCEISSLISSITSGLQCRLQTGLVPYCWGCLTLPITRPCFQLLRALPSLNHLDLNSSCWVCASGWIHFRKCQPKSENICIKKIWQPVCEWFFCPCTLQEGFDIWQADLSVGDEHTLKVCRKTHRSPKLAKVFSLCPCCKVQGPNEALVSSTMDVFPGRLLLPWSLRMFFTITTENKRKIPISY